MKLDELRALSEAATPGPWAKDRWSRRVIVKPPDTPTRPKSIVDARYANGDADAALIVAAVNYVRDLIR